jgi:hypothetical protein
MKKTFFNYIEKGRLTSNQSSKIIGGDDSQCGDKGYLTCQTRINCAPDGPITGKNHCTEYYACSTVENKNYCGTYNYLQS